MSGKNLFTRSLVIVQFVFSIFLIISSVTLGRQISYAINKDLGFDKEDVVVIRTQVGDRESSIRLLEQFRDRISQHSNIISISGASISSHRSNSTDFIEHNGKRFDVDVARISYGFFETHGIDFIEGRDFSKEYISDESAVVVNETLVREFGIDNPIGKPFEGYRIPLKIIGVVKDFHMRDRKSEILPSIYFINSDEQFIRFIFVKISPFKKSATLELLNLTWKELRPDRPFLYSFLDNDIKNEYINEKRWNNIVRFSSMLAVLISCLGVFGLTSISVRKRTKEVGIRKVHGASIRSIIKLLSKESVIWVLIANLIAWPAGWYFMNKWLQSYAYRINISPITFIIAGLITLILVLGTTCYQTIKAARANPVDSLRYE